MPRRNRNFCSACVYSRVMRSLLLQIFAGLNYGCGVLYLACMCKYAGKRNTTLAKAAAATTQLCIFFGAISLSFTSHARGQLYITYCLPRRYLRSVYMIIYVNLSFVLSLYTPYARLGLYNFIDNHVRVNRGKVVNAFGKESYLNFGLTGSGRVKKPLYSLFHIPCKIKSSKTFRICTPS